MFNKAWIEAMTLSDPKYCMFCRGAFGMHQPWNMLQNFTLKLSKVSLVLIMSVELYGYKFFRSISTNYVVNFSRDDPLVITHQADTHPYLSATILNFVFISQYWRAKLITCTRT